MIGVDLELQRRIAEGIGLPSPQQPAPAELSAQISEEPHFGAPELQAAPRADENIGALKTAASRSGAPEIASATFNEQPDSAPEIQPVPIEAPNFSAPEFDIRSLLVRPSSAKNYTVRLVARMEDAFSSAERELLRWLWERGRPIPVSPRIRLVTGPNGEGARRLATQAGLIYNTFKNLTRSLSAKFALDIVKPEKNLPAIYAVYEDSAILERQRERDFTRVMHKNGGGRELVNAQAQPARRRPDLTVEELEQIIRAPKFKPQATTIGAPNIALDALLQRAPGADVEAARAIVNACREVSPAIQDDEISRLIRTTPIPPSTANAVSLLIRVLPGLCVPETIASYRERWRQEDEEGKRRSEQERTQALATARRILDAVSRGEEWDTATMDWAKGVLAQN